ncbi:hypothetical protein ABH924_003275 [Arthrobacter sp. GAS37]|uniref:hypothetical protein n=1 Tax=Arthrobacter sp. GAS37 TaxID=3156261 RepID=UPI0038394891
MSGNLGADRQEQLRRARIARFFLLNTFCCLAVSIPTAIGSAATDTWAASFTVVIIFLPLVVGYSFVILWAEKRADEQADW